MTEPDLVALLRLKPHPEGGHYRETWRHPGGLGTAIYFFLRAGEVSHWHRLVDTEVWHFYAGAAVELSTSTDGIAMDKVVLGPDLAAGERPQAVVPAGSWQSARPLGAWTLAGCTVTPAFAFDRFELAPAGWTPGPAGEPTDA